nr:isochorismate synthase [uncultured bacterium]
MTALPIDREPRVPTDVLQLDDRQADTHPLRYQEVTVAAPGDPLLLAATLIESGICDTHVLYEQSGRWALGLGSLAEITARAGEVVFRTADGSHRRIECDGSPIDHVADLLEQVPISGWRAYGWAGFELAYAHAGLTDLLGDDTLLHLVVPHTEVLLDDGSALVRSTEPDVLTEVCRLLATPPPERRDVPSPVAVEHSNADQYRASVAAAIADIKDRLLQKVILSRVVEVDHPVDLVGTYVHGRRANNPARSFLLSLGGLRAAGFSPEIVSEVDAHGRVTTQPLAGTRRLDPSLRDDLLTDAKEIFEHAISVKVAWDELIELCEPGSVAVRDYMTIKERGSVQHLASSVSGQLAPGTGPWQAFATLFPAVTASGVPKRAAYSAIHRHEDQPRGLYSGAVITVDQSGAMDAALVLRTIFQQDGRTWLRAGAGVVEQSRPDREFEETCEKLRSVALHVVPTRTS